MSLDWDSIIEGWTTEFALLKHAMVSYLYVRTNIPVLGLITQAMLLKEYFTCPSEIWHLWNVYSETTRAWKVKVGNHIICLVKLTGIPTDIGLLKSFLPWLEKTPKRAIYQWLTQIRTEGVFGPFAGHILQAGGHENTLSGRQLDTIVYSCTQYGRPWIKNHDNGEMDFS